MTETNGKTMEQILDICYLQAEAIKVVANNAMKVAMDEMHTLTAKEQDLLNDAIASLRAIDALAGTIQTETEH